jgi:hypothetical protein
VKLFELDDLAKQCRKLAMVMIEKPPELESELSQMIQAFLKMNEDIFTYFPNRSDDLT